MQDEEWAWRWRVARGAFLTAASWILTLPILARVMRWHRQTVTQVQNIVGTISGLVWGRIGWVGVRRYGFSQKDAFLAGGLAGLVTPTFEFLLRSLGWPPGPRFRSERVIERPPLAAYPFAWFWGFLLGGVVALLGAIAARKGQE